MTNPTFASLSLNPSLLKALASLHFDSMTPIQAASLPLMLAGNDVIAQAKTGSGKTAAFALGLLQKLDPKDFNVQGLILCPTRELAEQVANDVRSLARSIQNIKVLTLCGGAPIGGQIASLARGAHIIVGTPGRIDDHLRKEKLDLSGVHTLVLDEADRMLDMGFQDTINAIIDKTPTARQTLLFSATYPHKIKAIAARVMRQPVMVKVEATHNKASIEQHFYKVQDKEERQLAVRLLLSSFKPESALVFCNTKLDVHQLCSYLRAHKVSAVELHGDLDQRERDQTLIRFANKSAKVLVATDVAARGLDIDILDAVINYHIALDPEVHVHRVGRTGRAGRQGLALSLYSNKESHKVALLESDVDPIAEVEGLPSMLVLDHAAELAPNITLKIDGGKKQKLRAGDILGALTGENGIAGSQVGKINLSENWAYVAVDRTVAKTALNKLMDGKLKGRSFRVRRL